MLAHRMAVMHDNYINGGDRAIDVQVKSLSLSLFRPVQMKRLLYAKKFLCKALSKKVHD